MPSADDVNVLAPRVDLDQVRIQLNERCLIEGVPQEERRGGLSDPKSRSITELKRVERQRIVLAAYLQIKDLKEVAKHLGLGYCTVRRYARDAEFQKWLKEQDEELWKKSFEEAKEAGNALTEMLEEASIHALETMESLLEETNPHVKFKAAQDLMDRNAQMSRTKKVEAVNPKSPLSAEALMLMSKTIQEEDGFEGTTIIATNG